MPALPALGAHVSIAGGLPLALERGEALGCEAIQIFVKNASQWQARPLDGALVEAFRRAHRASPVGPIVAHGTYLVNLAAPDPENLRRSRQTLGEELDRCRALGVGALVVHPGAHLGTGEDRGLATVAESLRLVLGGRPDDPTRLLLETTAGQGSTLGHRLQHLAAIRRQAGLGSRVGLCVDTCHVFAAGYAIHQPGGYEDFLAELTALFEPGAVGCLHLNDSRAAWGSRRDRHANIGTGEIGLEPFARLLGEDRLAALPMLLETPRGADGRGHADDLDLLRRLRGEASTPRPCRDRPLS